MQGVGFATGYDPNMDVREIADWMKRADERGFVMGFFSETIELNRDSVSALTAAALSTQHMTLGATQTVRIRNPLVMAQTIASLDEISGGRMILSPGACTDTHARRYGLEPISPPTTLREWVESIRLVLSGESASYHGEVVDFENAQLGFKPVRDNIPFLIPATSTTGLRLAGKIGDGVMLNAVCSPEYSANALAILKQSVDESGRNWDDFIVAQIVNCSIEDDHAAALDQVRWEVATKFDPIQLPFIAGPKMRVGEPYIKEEDIPRFKEAWERGGKEALLEAVPDSYVEGMTASGTPDEVKEKVARYHEVGVQIAVLRPAAKHQAQRLLDVFAE
ncbi:MAG TPA: LLM class flavin-dependent oxidoreductase [Acidimicrobiia bacterium]|nr:LLM class flavin-dependent oxidoreductase [Acidimicrobiia bacterium]